MTSLAKMAKEARARKKTVKPKQLPKKAPSPVNFKSTEYIQESDDEDDDKSAEESDIEDESLPENPISSEPKTNGKLPAPSGSSSSSEGESGEDEESSSEEESDADTQPAPAVLEPPKKTTKAPIAKSVTFDTPAIYNPPSGFELADIADGSRASQLLKNSNLAGKQIWYFTAPAYLPVSSIVQMSLEDAKKGNAIFSYEGDEYGFVQDTVADTIYTKMMLPNSSDDGYRTSSKPIDRVLHIQQIVKLPGVVVPGISSKATIPAAKPIRPQPKGLKIRYRPIGLSTGDMGEIGSSASEDDALDEEMEDGPSFQKPVTVGSDNEPADSDEEMTEAPPPQAESKSKKEESSKKKKKESSKGSLKRKHSEDREKKTKSSSYQPGDIDDRQLKRMKKMQNDSQQNMQDRAPASSKPKWSSQVSPPPPTSSAPSKPKLSSLPPVPEASQVSAMSADTDSMQSYQHSTFKKDRGIHRNPNRDRNHGLLLKELTRATDPSLTREERREKVKKLKSKSSGEV